MKVNRYLLRSTDDPRASDEVAGLVLGFRLELLLEETGIYASLRQQFSKAIIALLSSGETPHLRHRGPCERQNQTMTTTCLQELVHPISLR